MRKTLCGRQRTESPVVQSPQRCLRGAMTSDLGVPEVSLAAVSMMQRSGQDRETGEGSGEEQVRTCPRQVLGEGWA